MIYPCPKPPKREKKPRRFIPRSTKPIVKHGKRKARSQKAYRAHLASKYWKVLRCLIWQRDKGTCRDCGAVLDSIRDMEAAHITNKDFGAEKLSQVKCSCAPCNRAERAGRSWAIGGFSRK